MITALRERRGRLLALLSAVILLLGFLVFRHFLLTGTVAASVAVFLAPLQRRMRGASPARASLAAGLLVLLTAVMILLPILGSATLLSRQAVAFFEWARHHLQAEALKALWDENVKALLPRLGTWLSAAGDTVPQFISASLSRGVSAVNGLIQAAVTGLTSALFELSLFLMMLFFFLRDGPRLSAYLQGLSPLSPAQENQILDHVGRTVKGVLQAMVLVPFAQGLLAFVGFRIFGVPAPLLWSVMVTLAAFVPVLGSPLAWVPACGYLLYYGSTWQWVGMLVWGLAAISGIDNVVKPMVLRDSARIHPLLGFLAILGGLFSFGPAGFLVGPVILSLALSAIGIYRTEIQGAGATPAKSGSV